MAITAPHMQQRYTGYDFGQNTARNLLDAVRMKNEKEATDRSLNIAEIEARNRQLLFEQQQATKSAINKALSGQAKTRQSQEEKKKRMAESGSGGTLPYRFAQWLVDQTPFTYTPRRGWQAESKEARINRETGEAMDYRPTIDDFQDPNIDLRSIYPYLHNRENLLQQLKMQGQQPAHTQQLNYNPATGTYE